jgi:hypothetical protein
MDELDRILASDEAIQPSSGFAREVMDAVRSEADEPPPLPFPWLRLAAGLAVCAALAGLGIALWLRIGLPSFTFVFVPSRRCVATASLVGYTTVAALLTFLSNRLARVIVGR